MRECESLVSNNNKSTRLITLSPFLGVGVRRCIGLPVSGTIADVFAHLEPIRDVISPPDGRKTIELALVKRLSQT
jgi:hypothetical protein